jgi:hypothetical protein
METAEQLNSRIRLVYNALDDARVIAISPADLAEAVFKQIDPAKHSPVLVEIAAIPQLRQLARAICRKRQEESERSSEQVNLFDLQLQVRYPATRTINGEADDVYVLREHLTVEERIRNSARLRREAEAKMVHADALDAETDHLVRTGKLLKEDAPVNAEKEEVEIESGRNQ